MKRPSSLWISHALLSHWWRHPVQAGTLIIGLLAAIALWSGVEALNHQARLSYEQAANRFSALNQAHITKVAQSDTSTLTEADYIQLRRLGWPVTPVLQGRIAIEQQTFNLIGVEPVTMRSTTVASLNTWSSSSFSLTDFLSPPWEIWVSPNTARDLQPLFAQATDGDTQGAEGGFPLNPDGLPPRIHSSPSIADQDIFTDIYLAQHWLKKHGQLSHLLLTDSEYSHTLPEPLANTLQLIQPQSDQDISRLTDSFHLNLTALSLLAFLVGLLMVYSAMHLALSQRCALRRILLSCGVSQTQLLTGLLLEIWLLSSLIALPGLWLGYQIAAGLLPDVSASLSSLYGAQVSPTLQWSWSWWQQGMLMAWGGTFIAALMPLLQLIRSHPYQKTSPQPIATSGHYFRLGSGVGLIACAVAYWGESLLSGFVLIALIFLNAALWLPALMAKLLTYAERHAKSVIAQWLWADARLLLPHVNIALVALLLALSTSIGVGGMVEGFRNTLSGWLDQRLAAEVYWRPNTSTQTQEALSWLSTSPDVLAILPTAGTQILWQGLPVELRGIQVHSTYTEHWPLLDSAEQPWLALEHEAAIMINEQLARQLQLKLHDALSLDSAQTLALPIVAIYSDYGNPKGQILMSLDTLNQHWPDAQSGSFALRISAENVETFVAGFRERFNLSDTQVLDQQAIKRFSLQLFERTFAATNALNLLVLGVAMAALFSSLIGLSSLRLTQVAPIWACGVSRFTLACIELSRLLLLTLLTALLAIPLGLLISYCLVTVINVRAFGWALPWYSFPQHWLNLLISALCGALLAACVPIAQLLRCSPSTLLKGFRDEH